MYYWSQKCDIYYVLFSCYAILVSARMHWYAKLAAELDQMVARMIHESFGVEKYYESYKESITYLLRVLKNRAPKENEPALGFVAHTDKSFTTVLHQNQINGLEVETKDGEWITVEYSSPSSFVVMAGDALMVRHTAFNLNIFLFYFIYLLWLCVWVLI